MTYIAAFFAVWALGFVMGWKVRMIQRALSAA
jgi:hypothetical protein